MICVKCHRDIPDDANMCCYCGRKFVRKTSRRTRANGMGTAVRRGRGWRAVVVLGWKMSEDGSHRVPVYATKDGFPTKKEALEYCPVLMANGKVGKSADAIEDRKTIEYYWNLYESSGLLTVSHSKQTSYTIAHNKLCDIDNRLISDIAIKELQAVMDEKAKTYYPAKDIKTVLSKLFDLAIVDEVVATNKASALVLPKLDEEEPIPFSEEEMNRLWADYDAGNFFTGYILLMIYSSMMPGELLKCKKDMIHYDKRQIIGAGLKTKKRRETPIAIADFIAPVLEVLCENSSSDKLLTMNKDNFYKKYYDTLERIGCRKLPPYSCRHTTATALALGGNVAPAIIQKVMRHAKYSSTQRYIHATTDDALAALNTLKANPDAKDAEEIEQ